jgi:CheY-like chemotaxis protein
MHRILIIDDDAAVRSAIQLILDYEGYSVVAAADGFAGLDLLGSAVFDLAIVDIFMPGRDGLETIALIRQSAPDLPVIATSGAAVRADSSDSPDDVLGKATRLGAACVIHKPFRPRELLQAIKRCLPQVEGETRNEVPSPTDGAKRTAT